MPLFKGTIEVCFDILVDAEDCKEAKEIMIDKLEEEFSNCSDPDVITRNILEVKGKSEIPTDWIGCVPYVNWNRENNMRCEEYFEET